MHRLADTNRFSVHIWLQHERRNQLFTSKHQLQVCCSASSRAASTDTADHFRCFRSFKLSLWVSVVFLITGLTDPCSAHLPCFHNKTGWMYLPSSPSCCSFSPWLPASSSPSTEGGRQTGWLSSANFFPSNTTSALSNTGAFFPPLSAGFKAKDCCGLFSNAA